MVRQFTETKDQPSYPLDEVARLAKARKVMLASTRVENDLINLNYSYDYACACIQSLDESEFRKSGRYSANGQWQDVYRLKIKRPDCDGEEIDDLYIKLSIADGHVLLIMNSFHPWNRFL